MKPRYSNRRAQGLCVAFAEDDGIAPHDWPIEPFTQKTSRKQLQLCKEAARIISLVLSGETGQPLLRDLQVLSVRPEGIGHTLRVTVGYAYQTFAVDEIHILAALKTVQGLLRCALAQTLHRKQVPDLRFCYVGALGKGENDAH